MDRTSEVRAPTRQRRSTCGGRVGFTSNVFHGAKTIHPTSPLNDETYSPRPRDGRRDVAFHLAQPSQPPQNIRHNAIRNSNACLRFITPSTTPSTPTRALCRPLPNHPDAKPTVQTQTTVENASQRPPAKPPYRMQAQASPPKAESHLGPDVAPIHIRQPTPGCGGTGPR